VLFKPKNYPSDPYPTKLAIPIVSVVSIWLPIIPVGSKDIEETKGLPDGLVFHFNSTFNNQVPTQVSQHSMVHYFNQDETKFEVICDSAQ